MNNNSILEGTELGKTFGSLQVVNGVSLKVAAGFQLVLKMSPSPARTPFWS